MRGHWIKKDDPLAAEASFDDTAEGERLHRYQERWGRSLLRTLAKIEELRDRGQLDDEEAEEDFVGQSIDTVIPFIEETRSESCTTRGRDVDMGSAGSVGVYPVDEAERGHDRAAADDDSSRSEEKRQNKPTARTETVVSLASASGREEMRQNKPTTETRTVVKTEPCVERPVGNKATMVHSPCRESDQSASAIRAGACTAVVNFAYQE
jgi:hypothetical protein